MIALAAALFALAVLYFSIRVVVRHIRTKAAHKFMIRMYGKDWQ